MNLRISLIGVVPPPIGGISIYVKQLAEKLAEKGVNVEIIDIMGVKKELKREHIKLVVVKSWHTKEFVNALLKSQAKILHANVGTYRVDPLLLLMALTSRLRNKKFVITNLGGSFVELMERPIYRKILRIIALNLADGIITLSARAQRRKILEVIPPKKRGKVCSLLLPTDTKKFNPKVDGTIIRKKYNIKDNQNLVIFGPHLERIYAPDYFIKAASIVAKKKPDTIFMLLGDGALCKELEQMVKQMNLEKNVIFCGVIPFDDIHRYYAACDIYCNPCTLGQGISTFEAMACGNPVIGARVVQVKIRDKTDGLLFKLENTEDFANKIIWLLEHPDERKQMGINGRQRIEKIDSLEEHAQKLVEIYSRI